MDQYAKKVNTVNVDIFACINLRELTKKWQFRVDLIRVFDVIASMWHTKGNFQIVHIFADI